MAKALSGTNVVEFHSNLGAAYAAMLLAEQGAETIKVEPRGGAPERGTAHFHALNRSKRAVFLDADPERERAEMESLLRWADVVVTGHTPARLRALKLDFDSLQALNPNIVTLNISPFGARGPEADFEANEDLAAARAGITGNQWARSAAPVALVFPAASYSAGVMGASAAVAALIARERIGCGQSLDVSLIAGALSLQTGGVIRHERMTTLYHGPQDPLGPIPCYRLFEAADGKYLFVACGNTTFWGKFALALERPELVSDPRFENAPWGIAAENWQPLKDILEPIMRTRARDEWLRILRENDVPCAPVMTRQEFVEHPQVAALAMRREIDDPVLGCTVQPGIPVGLGETPGQILGPAPAAPVSADAARLTATDGAGASRKFAAASKPDRAGPLDGVTVLDFASYIAGSYGPMILAQLGANVIKIESLEGDSFRHFGFGFLGWNQGKRGLALNLQAPEAIDIVHGLAEKADIVVENLRPGRMKRFGLDYESLARRNPRLIYMSVTGFGNRGPEHNQPGFDPLLQARSGVMAAQGGHHGHPVYLTCAICDYGAAMLSAFGCLLALRARNRTGRGQFCETSLLQAAMAFQAGEFIFYKGRPDMENGNAEYRGRSALVRAYQCKDGEWLFLCVESGREWDSLRRVFAPLPPLAYEAAASEPNDGALAEALSATFAAIGRAEALSRLAGAGVRATQVHHFKDLFDDPQIVANDLIAELNHSEWGKVWQTGMLMKFSQTQGRIERAAPLHGEHTDEILRDYLGFDGKRIAALRARGIIK
jgi:crotonobetainyl-CoA:carnitine CoA-transferase CaiB-like acyl-CoA transferase